MAWDIAIDINTVIRSNDPNEPPVVTSKGIVQSPGDVRNLEGMKFDLAADPLGRGGKVTGPLKLAQQVVFAITNERIGRALSVFEFREYQGVIETVLQALQASQASFVSENDPEILGWDVEKLNPVTNAWKRLNNVPVTRILTDEKVESAYKSTYRISRRNKRSPAQSTVVEIVEVNPPCDSGSCEIQLGFQSVLVIPSKSSNTLFFAPNRFFTPGEIMDAIEGLNVREGSDPRQAVVSIRIRAVDGTVIERSVPRAILQGISYL
jgi:hypothetical protein